jgi:SOS-response transcriptional repressor LexA
VTPPAHSRPRDVFYAALVNGDSLSGDGIYDGFYVLVRQTFDRSELTPGRLIAVLTCYGLLLKRAYFTLDGKVRLVSSNPTYVDLLFRVDEVSVQGIVIAVLPERPSK